MAFFGSWLRRTFWFLTRQGRDTRRWGREQKLPHAESFNRVVASGSLSAASATLKRERAAAASLRARQRVGLLEEKPVVAAVKAVVAAATPSVDAVKPDLTSLLAFLAANPDVAATLDLDVTKPKLLAVRLDQLRLEPKVDSVDSKLDRPMNQNTSGARLASR